MRVALLVALLLVGLSSGAAAQPQPPKDFVPVDEATAEQIPAMPLIGTAYSLIWIGVLGYVWSLGRRLQQVERELSDLESRKK